MDGILFDRPIDPLRPLARVDRISGSGSTPAPAGPAPQVQPSPKAIQTAKDFESIVLTQMFDQMRQSVGDWGMDKELCSDQINGIFWLCMGQELGTKGGLGLWKQIAQELQANEPQSGALDSSL